MHNATTAAPYAEFKASDDVGDRRTTSSFQAPFSVCRAAGEMT